MDDIAIIGAGLAGLTAARALRDAGRRVVVFDKSRGLGGRLATRRSGAGGAAGIDHGAPMAHPGGADFASLMAALTAAGAAAPWREGHIGLPGMSGLVAPLAEDLEIWREVEIAAIGGLPDAWQLMDTQGHAHGPFARVISAIPAPQATRFSDDPGLGAVTMAPVWTLLLTLADAARPTDPPSAAGPFARIIPGWDKPGRAAALVAHCSPGFTRDNLEAGRDEMATRLYTELSRQIGPIPITALAAHRWRFGLTETPLGAPYLATRGGQVLLGGDWALGPRAHHAHASGRAMAAALLGEGGA